MKNKPFICQQKRIFIAKNTTSDQNGNEILKNQEQVG